jgi:hypothetical protein
MAVVLCSCTGNDASGNPDTEINPGIGKPDSEIIDNPVNSDLEITGSQTIDNTKQDGDVDMVLATKEEFLEHLKEKCTAEQLSAFEKIDLDDYIKEYEVTTDYLQGGGHPEWFIDGYHLTKAIQRKSAPMAKEIISVDSTEEEYQAFVAAYAKALDKEFLFKETDTYLLMDIYYFDVEDKRYRVCIGKTKNIGMYDIRQDGDYGTCHIYIPSGDMSMRIQFCYSSDNKFFLITSDSLDEFTISLSEIFTKVKPQ